MDDKIKPLALTLHSKRTQLTKITDQMKDLKTCYFLDILELSKDKDIAKDQNLTNETGRTIALDFRLKEDPEYQRLLVVRDALENDIALLQIDLEHERYSFEVWKICELQKVMGLV